MTPVVLVTGASGTLGRAVMTSVAAKGATAVPHQGRSDGDLTDPATCADLIGSVRPDAVINTAGRTYGGAAEIWSSNLLLPLRLAESIAARAPGARLVLTGSAAEYGLSDRPGTSLAEDTPCRPNSEYGMSKLAAGRTATLLVQHCCTARVFNLLDPHADARALLPRVDAARDAGAPLPADAGAVRDWVTVAFAATALAALAAAADVPPVVNICSGEGRSAAEVLGIPRDVVPAPETWSVGDPRLLRECTGLAASRGDYSS